ncbi:DMT family transporter [Marinomonas balearica]|uniref:Drug/metabolite transporter (DMT)-like permease n=1 Tax=Marinomonas balearica TaxID=491947 RepID=A0A4R6M9Y8_9GAMM|nr:DMT family transporter [Marinomonas balearica]TDO98263.1 drug/metabolite transporter (DMT)-like permease [Marinomonas balearica]
MLKSPNAYTFLLFSIVFWSGNYVLGRLTLSEGMDPYTLSFFRWFLACAFLLPFTYRTLVNERKILMQNLPLLTLMGVLGVCNYNLFLYIALTTTTVTNAVLLNSLMPILILLVARILLGARTSKLQNIGIAVSTIGATTIVSRGSLDTLLHLTITKGDMWVITAVTSWALYSVLLSKRPKKMSLYAFFTSTAIIGTLAQAPIYAIFGTQSILDIPDHNWLVLLYMALFASIAAFICWNKGIEKLGPATAGHFIHLMPVFSIALSIPLLGEQFHVFHMVGVAFILGGILTATILNKKFEAQH